MTFSDMTGRRVLAVAPLALAWVGASGALVTMDFTPDDQTVCVGDIVEIDLIFSSEGPDPQPFDATDAILCWDTAFLQLIGNDDSDAGATWFISGFLPDVDGVNDDLTDGEAIYTALASPGTTVTAPLAPDTLVVTTFQFAALAETTLTELELRATIGVFGQSRVLLVGGNITGTLGGPAGVSELQSCPADCALPCDGVVNVLDFLTLLAQWGQDAPCDVNDDSTVDVVDFLAMLAAWGPCP
jgi:hypothetical protein